MGKIVMIPHLNNEDEEIKHWENMKKKGQKHIPGFRTFHHMLYVRIVINGFSTLAFIDTGAGASFLSASFVKKAGIQHKVDSRFCRYFGSMAGPWKTDGTIFSCFCEIGGSQWEAEFSVFNDPHDVLIGLDFLQRHKWKIDLSRQRLILKDDVDVEFASDREINDWKNRKASQQQQLAIDELMLNELVPEHVKSSAKIWQKFRQKNEDNEETSTVSAPEIDSMKLTLCDEDRITIVELRNYSPVENLIALEKLQINEEEEECRQLFQKMNRPKIKCEYYFAWKPLHDHYVKNPSDYDGFKLVYSSFFLAEKQKRQLMGNPCSVEGQKLITKKIRVENWDKMKKQAEASNPKTGNVHPSRIYIKLAINGFNTIAHVDTGAFISIIPPSLAKKAGLEPDIDTRLKKSVEGANRGSGTTTGIIHLCSLKICNTTFNSSFHVMREVSTMILGLDFLSRYECLLDFDKHRVSFNGNTYAEFLSEREISDQVPANFFAEKKDIKEDKNKVAELVDIGFTEREAKDALRTLSNDMDYAVRYLYDRADKEYMRANTRQTNDEQAETSQQNEVKDK